MSETIFSNKQKGKTVDHDKGVKQVNPVGYHKLGTKNNPATVSVQTEEREKELTAVFKKNNWASKIICAPDQAEDISALEILLNPVQTKINEHNIGRNEPCYCGSGKKFKKCCG